MHGAGGWPVWALRSQELLSHSADELLLGRREPGDQYGDRPRSRSVRWPRGIDEIAHRHVEHGREPRERVKCGKALTALHTSDRVGLDPDLFTQGSLTQPSALPYGAKPASEGPAQVAFEFSHDARLPSDDRGFHSRPGRGMTAELAVQREVPVFLGLIMSAEVSFAADRVTKLCGPPPQTTLATQTERALETEVQARLRGVAEGGAGASEASSASYITLLSQDQTARDLALYRTCMYFANGLISADQWNEERRLIQGLGGSTPVSPGARGAVGVAPVPEVVKPMTYIGSWTVKTTGITAFGYCTAEQRVLEKSTYTWVVRKSSEGGDGDLTVDVVDGQTSFPKLDARVDDDTLVAYAVLRGNETALTYQLHPDPGNTSFSGFRTWFNRVDILGGDMAPCVLTWHVAGTRTP